MSDHGGHFNNAVANVGLILLAEVGSTVQGTNLSGANDTDLQGICIESPGVLLGHRQFEQCITKRDKDGQPVPKDQRTPADGEDRTVYSLKKWTSLAVKGNPSVLLPLFVPEDKLHFVNSFGDEVRGKSEMFLSKQCAFAFRGYLNRQKLNAFSDLRHTNRPELVAEFGFDTKSAYHALRLAIQGKELMDTHHITLPIDKGWRDYLLAVRKGQIQLSSVLAMLEHNIYLLEQSALSTTLPDRVDLNAVDVWITGMYKTWWKECSWV